MPRGRKPRPHVTLAHISRAEGRHGYGWVVTLTRRQRWYAKYFPDGRTGPLNSLRRAIFWRDRAWLATGPATHPRSKPGPRRSTDRIGVQRETYETTAGNPAERYRAQWHDELDRLQRAAFSIDKFGEAEARRRAIRARDEGVAAAEKTRWTRLRDLVHTHRAILGDPPSDLPPVAESRPRDSRRHRRTRS